MSQTTLKAPCHLVPHRTPRPWGLYHLVPLPLLPWNTDLLVGSLLHTPRASLPGPGKALVAGHQRFSRAEGAAHPGNQPVYLT